MNMNKQKALDCTTGLDRELTTNEKLLLQNDQHLQTHLKILEELLSLKKRIEELTGRVEHLEADTKNIYLEVFD